MFSLLPTLQNEGKPPPMITSPVPDELPIARKTLNTKPVNSLNNKPVNSVLQNEIKSEEPPPPPLEICAAAPPPTKSTNHNHSNSNGEEPVEEDPMEQKGLEELIKFINGTDDNNVGGKQQHSAKAAKRARQKQRKVKGRNFCFRVCFR